MLEELEIYAKENRIPIMLKDGIEYLCNYIKEHNIKSILEIGSAIGYSSIKMALVDNDIYITTIEKDIDRYNLAVSNIKKFNLKDRIKILNEDALDSKITDSFDLIFIDASKGNNTNFFNKYKINLNSNGVIVTDNLSFHGLVEDENLIKTKNQRGIVKKIKNYLDFLENNHEFITEYIPVGDRISISKRNSIINNLIIKPNKKEDILLIDKLNVHGIILPLEDLSVYSSFNLSIDEIININTSKEKIVLMNKIMHNADLPLIEKALIELAESDVTKIIFYDMAVYNIYKKLNINNIELVIGQDHLNRSINSNMFYHDLGINYSYITSDITIDEIKDIHEQSDIKLFYTVYGMIPLFCSRRYLLSNYFEYIDKEYKDGNYYIENTNNKLPIVEEDNATIIYSDIVNLINELDNLKFIDYLVLDFNNINLDINIINNFINNIKDDNEYYKGFYDKKTIFKVK